MSSSSRHGNDQKPRISKTEKIAELLGKLKLLTEENKQLKRESKKNSSLSASQHSRDDIEQNSVSNGKPIGGRDKLKEALRALKRVTVKQEMSLATLRQRSKQRRGEIEQKNKIMKKLQEENKAYRIAHEKIREDNGNDDLRARIADLELQLAKEENTKVEQSEKLKEREAGITSLQAKLSNKNKGGIRGVSRNASSDSSVGGSSIASASSSSTSTEDVDRMKRNLAKKMEKITNLQHELEACKDEIHDLKQKDQFSSAFPSMTPAQSDDDDFFDDDDGDNDVWAAF
jgi:hypothetical protein